MNILETIKKLCASEGISTQELERRIGLGKRSIENWSKSSPSVENLQKVADYFRVSLDVIVGNETPQFELADLSDLKYLHDNPDLHILLTAAKDLPKDSIEAMAAIARRMNNSDI